MAADGAVSKDNAAPPGASRAKKDRRWEGPCPEEDTRRDATEPISGDWPLPAATPPQPRPDVGGVGGGPLPSLLLEKKERQKIQANEQRAAQVKARPKRIQGAPETARS